MSTRRLIRIGERVVEAAVCDLCVSHPAIWPAAAMLAHQQRHIEGAALVAHEANIIQPAPRVRYWRGRTPGSRNRLSMSSTGWSRAHISLKAR